MADPKGILVGPEGKWEPGPMRYGRPGGWGGFGGGFNLNAQLQAFDPSVLMDYANNLKVAMHARARDEAMKDAYRSKNLHRPLVPSGMAGNPFQTNLRDLNYMQSQDPWAGQGFGQVAGRQFFNFPAASAMTFGKDVFPDGFDTYSRMMAGAGGVNPGQQGLFGQNQRWGVGF